MSKTITFHTLGTIVTTISITQVLMKMFNHFDLYFIAVCTKRLAKPARRKFNSNNDHPKDNAHRCKWDNAQRVKRPRYAQKNAKRKHPDKKLKDAFLRDLTCWQISPFMPPISRLTSFLSIKRQAVVDCVIGHFVSTGDRGETELAEWIEHNNIAALLDIFN